MKMLRLLPSWVPRVPERQFNRDGVDRDGATESKEGRPPGATGGGWAIDRARRLFHPSRGNTEMAAGMTRTLLYFADPMCSWCWGFSPVIREIAAAVGERASVRLIVGGLRTGRTHAMDAKAKAVIRHHWEAVAEATGQPFSFAFFDREGFVYDTEAACRAMVVMRSFAPGATLSYLDAVQRAFYAGNRDVTDPNVLATVAGPFGLDANTFSALFDAPEIIEATRADFRAAAAAGVTGFPTVVLRDGDNFSLLTAGYQPLKALKPHLDQWLGGED
jgi:putative protein-disulfide isomerase